MFDHFIGIDWAQTNMAITRITKSGIAKETQDVESNVAELIAYLESLRGSKIVTIEESTSSQWLYTKLKPYADKVLVCDPRRNRLLSEGAKNDKIDSQKLALLLYKGLLKEVFHSGDFFYSLRKLVSGYEDVIKAGVRNKNQLSAIYRANGYKPSLPIASCKWDDSDSFVVERLQQNIETYEIQKKEYQSKFSNLVKQHKSLKNLKSLPGIDVIGAVKIASRVVDPKRFSTKGRFLAYSGLIKHELISGGRVYGKRSPNYSRTLKNVFDVAALTALKGGENNYLRIRYEYLKNVKNLPDYKARRALSRHVATLALAILKSGKSFDKNKWRNAQKNKM